MRRTMLRPMKSFGFSAGLLLASGFAAAAQLVPLIEAVKQQDRVAVNALLDRGTDVHAAEADGSTALHWAAQRDDLTLVEAMLEAGADVNAATRFGVTPLSLASNNGSAAVVTRLLAAGADPEAISREGQTPLMSAVLNGRPGAVDALLVHGADPNSAEAYRGQTALMWAAGEGNVEAAQLLIDAGANVTVRSNSGFTAVLFAVRNAHIGTVRLLLDNGANVNDLAPDGTSALNVAIVNAFFELASVLLDYGADPNLPDARGSPLHSIAWLNKPGVTGDAGVGELPRLAPQPTGEVTALELAARLLDHGADPERRIDWEEIRFDPVGGTARNPSGLTLGRHLLTYNGATPFYVAAKNGDAPLMRLLADAGADPLAPNRFGITPLMMAAGMDTWEGETPGPFTGVSEAERLEAVRLAVELGNDVNAVADFGDFKMTGDPEYTLLYYPHNLDELADLGVGDPRWSGSTALHGAIISNQPSIVQYLVDQGAKLDARTETGWTPLMMTRGVFLTNTGRVFPEAEEILVRAFAERGLTER